MDGKQKRLALGAYPMVSLEQARRARDDARRLVANGSDPVAEKHAAVAAQTAEFEHTFENIAREWFDSQSVT